MSGERIFTLQKMLKIEKVSNAIEYKSIDNMNKMVRDKSEALFEQLHQIRDLENSIALLLADRVGTLSVGTITSGRVVTDYFDQTGSRTTDQSIVFYPLMADREKIERLIRLLRQHPDVLASTLLVRPQYMSSSLAKEASLSHSIISIYGNCITANDEYLFLQLIKTIIDREFDVFIQDPKNIDPSTRLPSTSSFSQMEHYAYVLLNAHLSITYTTPYITILLDIIESIVSNKYFSFGDDPPGGSREASQPPPSRQSEQYKQEILDSEAFEFICRVVDQVDKIPYALRWLSKHIIDLGRYLIPLEGSSGNIPTSLDKLTESDKLTIFYTIFGNLLIPILIKPDQFIGIDTRSNVKNNLSRLAKRITLFMTDPQSIPDRLSKILLTKIDQFNQHILNVEDLNDYFKVPKNFNQNDYKIPISMLDLLKILEAIESKKDTFKDQNDISPETLECIKLAQEIKPIINFNHGFRFIHLTIVGHDELKPEKKNLSMEENLIKLVKNQLKQSLLMLSQLCGCSISNNIITILNTQQNRNMDSKFPLILQETIQSLNRLPTNYQQDDFKLLLDEIFKDMDNEQKKIEWEKARILNRLCDLDDQLELNVKSQTKILIDSLVFFKLKCISQEETFITNQEMLVKAVKIITEKKELCHCNIIKRFLNPPKVGEIIIDCKVCQSLSNLLSNVLRRPKEELKASWPGSMKGLKKALFSLEKSIISQLYNEIFMFSENDATFSSKLNSLRYELTPKSFCIDETIYGNLLPFETAQQQLRKLSLFRSPHDKIQIIMDTWSIVTNMMKSLGQEFAPECYNDIMAFVIYKANVQQLLSNIQFIQLYASPESLEDHESQWLFTFIGSVSHLDNIVEEHLKNHA
ncbi:hypothetical protein DFA_09116 [Cavenderia fasciculata]|uniref:RasGTPase-activating protein n=1 Tax=Cavenderia fasciculata TaxID=261658 RepID=F4Q6Q9_CACFS|nr:uncharacterized protein DFA_09116 [Cavenderia fasciculata]EGG16569.1 hypothetical protein DFA_09116 [Cavenderia fasciculata]|eukprot:XP_004354969.1 hypothetical protein DFA_09116 [Cavenderia fasciculata]